MKPRFPGHPDTAVNLDAIARRRIIAVVAKFADAIVGPENREAARGLYGDFVVHMAKIEEVGAGDHEKPLRWEQGHHARSVRHARLQRRGRAITVSYDRARCRPVRRRGSSIRS